MVVAWYSWRSRVTQSGSARTLLILPYVRYAPRRTYLPAARCWKGFTPAGLTGPCTNSCSSCCAALIDRKQLASKQRLGRSTKSSDHHQHDTESAFSMNPGDDVRQRWCCSRDLACPDCPCIVAAVPSFLCGSVHTVYSVDTASSTALCTSHCWQACIAPHRNTSGFAVGDTPSRALRIAGRSGLECEVGSTLYLCLLRAKKLHQASSHPADERWSRRAQEEEDSRHFIRLARRGRRLRVGFHGSCWPC